MMKKDLDHPAFPEPDLTAEAWRYMPLSQLLSILLTGELPLIRVDLLGDPFEGSVTAEVLAQDVVMSMGTTRFGRTYGPRAGQAMTPTEVLEEFRRTRVSILRSSHASCWRMGKESEGMWRLYCGQKDGIALRTTCAKLKDSITDDATRLGQVTYIDYAAGGMPHDNFLYAVMFKRDGFADEHEVRLLRYLQGDADAVLRDPELKPGPSVRKMKWDVRSVLEQIVVSPYSDPWYFDTVQLAVQKLSPEVAGRVVWSRLRAEPKR
jgi:hypothetical protein